MRTPFLPVLCLLALLPAAPASESKPGGPEKSPRLVVVISLDQFRFDYLVRLREHFGPDGFRRLLDGGASFVNCRWPYAETNTAAGHSVLLSGAYPDVTGIINNSWYDRETGLMVYATFDSTAPLVGVAHANALAGRSPRSMRTATLGDMLRLATGRAAHTVSVSLKDRAAILMGGYLCESVYWLDTPSGLFVTSRYYRAALPAYLEQFNQSHAAQAWLGKQWTLSRPAGDYQRFTPDEGSFGHSLPPLGRTFPHSLPTTANGGYYTALEFTPYGNELVLQVAELLIEREKLGRDAVTDLLTINLPSTDYVGHAFGGSSVEQQDTIYRTDAQLARFLELLDRRIGRGNWLLALTSDHGVGPIPEYARALNLGGARRPLASAALQERIERALRRSFGDPPTRASWVLKLIGNAVYLNHHLSERGIDAFPAAQRICRDILLEDPNVAAAFTREELRGGGGGTLGRRFALSYAEGRSGDVMFALRPFMIQEDEAGFLAANHGTLWDYDAHVPLILFGPGIRPGRYLREVSPADLAPTLAVLLGVTFPPGCAGQVLREAVVP